MLREGKQRILVIVEGERVGPAILERCFEILNLGIDYEIVPFRTNVYQLIRHIDRFYGDDIDSIDIRKILKERSPDTRRPNLSAECLDLDLGGLLRLQGEKVAKGGCVYVCGTCLFFLCENWGSSIDGIWRKALS